MFSTNGTVTHMIACSVRDSGASDVQLNMDARTLCRGRMKLLHCEYFCQEWSVPVCNRKVLWWQDGKHTAKQQ